MKLYHGTTEAVARKAMKDGLKPRISTGKSNWKHTSESNPSMVYLTEAYAPYFAICAAEKNEKLAIIEIDTEKLDEGLFYPDEDAIQQGTTGNELGIKGKSPKARTRWIRDHLNRFQEYWKPSLHIIGNCAYKGIIPPSAITRVVLNNRTNLKMEWQAIDPAITTMNYKFYGGKYRTLTQWYLGEKVTVEQWFSATLMPAHFFTPEEETQIKAAWKDILTDQSSVEPILGASSNTKKCMISRSSVGANPTLTTTVR
jgi:hypothetical protein